MSGIVTISSRHTKEFFFSTDHCQDHKLGSGWVPVTHYNGQTVEFIRESYNKPPYQAYTEIVNPDPKFILSGIDVVEDPTKVIKSLQDCGIGYESYHVYPNGESSIEINDVVNVRVLNGRMIIVVQCDKNVRPSFSPDYKTIEEMISNLSIIIKHHSGVEG